VSPLVRHPQNRSPAQIASHYAAAAPPPASYAGRVLADGATAYWRLDETSGTHRRAGDRDAEALQH